MTRSTKPLDVGDRVAVYQHDSARAGTRVVGRVSALHECDVLRIQIEAEVGFGGFVSAHRKQCRRLVPAKSSGRRWALRGGRGGEVFLVKGETIRLDEIVHVVEARGKR